MLHLKVYKSLVKKRLVVNYNYEIKTRLIQFMAAQLLSFVIINMVYVRAGQQRSYSLIIVYRDYVRAGQNLLEYSGLVGLVAWRVSFLRIITVAIDRLSQVKLGKLNDCPAEDQKIRPTGLKPPAGARNRIKAGVKMRRNPARQQTDQVRKFLYYQLKVVKP